MTLDELELHAKARVKEVLGADQISVRLLEMGLTPGVELELIGRAPLGDPLEIMVRGYRLSVRLSEAARVHIHPA